jgi:peroxiredoxin
MNLRLLTSFCVALALNPVSVTLAVEAGKPAPDCALTAIGDGKIHGLKQFQGKVVYVDFWSSWCPPCAKSFSFMNELHHELNDKGLQVVGVNLDEVAEDAQAFLAQHPAHFAVATDANQQCAKDFAVKAMPSSYLIDRNGVVRHVHYGFRPDEAKAFKLEAEQLLAENPAPK